VIFGKGDRQNLSCYTRLLAEVGKRGKGKGESFGIFLSPLTFYLFPQECKKHFCKRSTDLPINPQSPHPGFASNWAALCPYNRYDFFEFIHI